MKLLGWLGLVFLTIGLVFDGVALATYLEARAFRARARHAEGTVIENVERPSSSPNKDRKRFKTGSAARPLAVLAARIA